MASASISADALELVAELESDPEPDLRSPSRSEWPLSDCRRGDESGVGISPCNTLGDWTRSNECWQVIEAGREPNEESGGVGRLVTLKSAWVGVISRSTSASELGSELGPELTSGSESGSRFGSAVLWRLCDEGSVTDTGVEGGVGVRGGLAGTARRAHGVSTSSGELRI